MTADGASSALPPTPAKVALPKRQPPFRLGGRNWSSCPIPDLDRPRSVVGARWIPAVSECLISMTSHSVVPDLYGHYGMHK
jgi:hypothetical protein